MTSGSVSVIMNARPDNITTFDTKAFNGSKNGEFITPYASEWKESGKCSYDSTNNRITFDNRYKGIFTLSTVTYTVTFKDYDGTVLKTQENVEYNTSATAPDDPTRDGYTFTGWDKTFTNITANTEVKAQYEINKYTVTFKDYDGTVLKTQENVEYKKSAIAPAEPTRTGYTFTGWDKAFTEITADTTITATYSIISYTVTWTNYDDTVLKTDTVDYGETPAYTGATPTKPADAQYTYTFVGWTPEINTVTGDVTYKATYTNAKNKYTVRWLNYDNTVLQEGTVDYGETPEYTGDTPTKPADEQYTYTFVGWTPVVVPVVDNVVYIATYTQTEIKKDDGEKAVSTEVKKDEKSPEVKAANLTNEFAESTLSNEEKADIEDAINNGEDVKVDVYLEIEDISDTISASDKEKIKA
ncbi:MAG: InlB B-repeat-containing protein, partial [Lachnospiraceae bacterium]|nr:InlB B-repeat-containing protein [Lachnospiraceae bacterium]